MHRWSSVYKQVHNKKNVTSCKYRINNKASRNKRILITLMSSVWMCACEINCDLWGTPNKSSSKWKIDVATIKCTSNGTKKHHATTNCENQIQKNAARSVIWKYSITAEKNRAGQSSKWYRETPKMAKKTKHDCRNFCLGYSTHCVWLEWNVSLLVC
jgi:uncharacterized protein (DUF2235 family)